MQGFNMHGSHDTYAQSPLYKSPRADYGRYNTLGTSVRRTTLQRTTRRERRRGHMRLHRLAGPTTRVGALLEFGTTRAFPDKPIPFGPRVGPERLFERGR